MLSLLHGIGSTVEREACAEAMSIVDSPDRSHQSNNVKSRIPMHITGILMLIIASIAPTYFLTVSMTKVRTTPKITVDAIRQRQNTSWNYKEYEYVSDPNPSEPVPKIAWLMTYPNSVCIVSSFLRL